MQHYPVPLRDGETLGAYKDWAFELWCLIEQINVDQAAEREFYTGEPARVDASCQER